MSSGTMTGLLAVLITTLEPLQIDSTLKSLKSSIACFCVNSHIASEPPRLLRGSVNGSSSASERGKRPVEKLGETQAMSATPFFTWSGSWPTVPPSCSAG